ncbi:MAG: ATP-dependent RNA helicase HrpA [Chitinispirillaceae bacterium]|nr:ATP-dependent RNA helicase HrpA [Chitinispirillaceae bacterium]
MNANDLTLLPVYEHKNEILSALKEHQVLIVAGDTGSGKSTCLPLICYEAGYTKEGANIVVTQPRRIAAVSLAKYLSKIGGFILGKDIGYWIRFKQRAQKDTPIIYMTDGILLATLSQDHLLSKYRIIIIDEAHERSLRIDFLLGWIKSILPKRPELKLIISSATIDLHIFTRAFKNAAIIEIPVKRFKIDIRYKPVIELWKGYSIDSFIEGAIQTVEDICNSGEKGDILIFLPTIDNVSECARRLVHRIKEPNVSVFTLHSHLSSQKQQEVFKRCKGRKIVVATNIAETSLTVPGIKFVIDSGLVRILRYEPTAAICRMPIEKISQASAEQRAGRCGREADGICIRLYSEADYLSRPKFTQPEIVRTNIAELILKLHFLNYENIRRFPFIQQPKNAAIVDGYRQLQDLGAIDRRLRITSFGASVASLPLEPPVATLLLKARNFGAVMPVMVITAALSVLEPLLSAETGNIADLKELRDKDSDFITYINVWKKLNIMSKKAKRDIFYVVDSFCEKYKLIPSRVKEWIEAFRHIKRICEEFNLFKDSIFSLNASYEAIHKALLCGLINGIATLKDKGVYEGLFAKEIRIALSSVNARKDRKWLLLHEIIETDHIYALRSAVISPRWIEEVFKERCSYRYKDPWYDPERGKVMIYEEVSYKNLTLIHNRLRECHLINKDLACKVFINDALVKGQLTEEYKFIRHNNNILKSISIAESKLRCKLYRGEEALYNFYSERINIATRKDLNSLIKQKSNDKFLYVKYEDLCYDFSLQDLEDYWDKIKIGEYEFNINWRYTPNTEEDGATIEIPKKIALIIPSYYWEWYPPALRKKRCEFIAQRLEYNLISKGIDPEVFKNDLISSQTIKDCEWIEYIISFCKEKYNLVLEKEDIIASIPYYLWLRVIVVGEDGSYKVNFRPPLTYWKKEINNHHFCEGKKIPTKILDFYVTKDEKVDLWYKKTLSSIFIPEEKEKMALFFYPAISKNGIKEEIEFFFSKRAAFTLNVETIKKLIEENLCEELCWQMEKVNIPPILETKRGRCGIKIETKEILTHLLLSLTLEEPQILPQKREDFEKYLKIVSNNISDNLKKAYYLINEFFDKYEISKESLEKKRKAYSYKDYENTLEELDSALQEYLNYFTNRKCPLKYLLKIPEYLNAFPYRVTYAFLEPQKYLSLMDDIYRCSEILEEAECINDYTTYLLYWELKNSVEDSIVLLVTNSNKKNLKSVIIKEIQIKKSSLLEAINELYKE